MDGDEYADILARFPQHRLVKRGGQKVVFVVDDRDRGQVVLKIGRSTSAREIRRAEREVLLMQQLDSPYFPKPLDFEVLADGRFVLLEEFINGRPLSECMDLFTGPPAVLDLLSDLVTAMEVLWDRGIVHRDIKPDNILITEHGRPKVIDLGIARVLGVESITQTSAWFGPGTPNYAPKEQRLNRKADIDWRADQFCLGIVGFELLTGRHPFDPSVVSSGDSISDNIMRGKWYRAAFEEPALRTLRRLFTRLLGTEPYQRYRSAAALREDLELCRGRLS